MKFRFPILWPQTGDGSRTPALCALGLAAMIALQFMMPPGVKIPQAGGVARPPALPNYDFSVAPIPPVILARPLFAPSRVIGAISSQGGGGPLDGAIVAGSVSIRGRSFAIVQAPSGKLTNLPVRGTYSNWTLLALTTEGARFGRGKERLDLPFGKPSSDAATPPTETPNE